MIEYIPCVGQLAWVGLMRGGGIPCTKPSYQTVLSGKYTSTISKHVIPPIKAVGECALNNALGEVMYGVQSTYLQTKLT